MLEPATNFSEPSASQPLASPPAATNSVFRGPNGIRAGWRVLIFLAIMAALVAAVNLVVWLVVHFLLHRESHQFQPVSALHRLLRS